LPHENTRERHEIIANARSSATYSATRSTSSCGREDAERFIDEIRGDDPELAKPLRIVERELNTGPLNENAKGGPRAALA
jgi:hypothetical protein